MSLRMRVLGRWATLTQQRRMRTVARARQHLAEPKGYPWPPQKLCQRHTVRTERVDGRDVFTVEPRTARKATRGGGRVVVFLHGGTYVSEMLPQHWELVSRMVDGGCRVDVPSYGLAPTHTVVDGIDFVTAAYEYVRTDSGTDDVILAGDTAGGGLALAVAQHLVATDRPAPRRLVLVSPWLDATLSNPDIAEIDDPWLHPVGLAECGRAWAGPLDPADPRVSPLYGDLAGLPPIDAYVGTRDLFHPDVLDLASRCAAAGVTCQVEEITGAVHSYPLTQTPEGRASRTRLVRSLTG